MTKRRTKGDGALFQRASDGRWVGRFMVTIDGRKKPKTVYGRTQKEARIKLARAIRERDAGTLVLSTVTVETWAAYWLDNIAAENVKPQTLRAYRSVVKHHIVPHLGGTRLTSLTPEHIDRWLRALRATPSRQVGTLSPGTIRQAHAVLRALIREAVKRRKMAYDPTVAANVPHNPKVHRDRLTTEQGIEALAAAGADPRWWLALFYGMRQGECLGLRWGDVDFTRGCLTINQTLQVAAGGRVLFGPPKSKSSQRTIPLLPQPGLALRLHKPSGADDEELVFTTADGAPVKPHVDLAAWRTLLASANLPPVTLHSARNTAGGIMEEYGVPDRLIAQILGHSSVHMTHGYVRADVERERQALMAASAAMPAIEA